MKVERLETYSVETAERMRELVRQLSRSGKDKGEIAEEWFQEVIESPWHDVLVAKDEEGRIVGMANVSVVMGAGIGKNAYLEDFVTDAEVRGKGVGSMLWEAILAWAEEKGCRNLEFTCGNGRENAQEFYRRHGAEVYETNFFRRKIVE